MVLLVVKAGNRLAQDVGKGELKRKSLSLLDIM